MTVTPIFLPKLKAALKDFADEVSYVPADVGARWRPQLLAMMQSLDDPEMFSSLDEPADEAMSGMRQSIAETPPALRKDWWAITLGVAILTIDGWSGARILKSTFNHRSFPK